MADTDAVQFASTNSSPRMSRAYTTAFTSLGGYMRVRATNTAQNGFWVSIETSGSYWFITPGGDNVLYHDSTAASGEIINPHGTGWLDLGWTANGSNVDVYYKAAAAGSWSGPVSFTRDTFTPATYTISGSTNFVNDGDATMRIGKLVIWTTTRTSTELLNEAGSRDLVNTGSVFFYNRCTDASTVGTDGGGGGNNFTVTGSPTTVSDDPGFPSGGGGGGAFGPRRALMGVGRRRPDRPEWTRREGGLIYTRRFGPVRDTFAIQQRDRRKKGNNDEHQTADEKR